MQYRFSPIQDKEKLIEAVTYVATQTSDLAKKIIGQTLPITSLTIFTHDSEEYDRLVTILHELGKPYNEHNGPRVALFEPIKVGEHSIAHLRIRKPDQDRPHVGCNDFDVSDYQEFKSKHLIVDAKNLRLIERPNYEMIEFFDPEYDVLAYIVS